MAVLLLGDAGISLIDARDIGDVCPVLLTEDRWQTVVLTGARPVTTDVERVLGHPPRTVEDYLHECRDALAGPAA